MQLRKLVKELNELCSRLVEKYNINYGGCCFVASIISKYLDQLGIEYKLIVYDYGDKNLHYIRKELHNKRCNLCNEYSIVGENNCYHYSLHVKYAGEINPDDSDSSISKYYINNINNNIIRWIYNKGYWNTDYDTNNNKIIGKLIKSIFKHYGI